MVLLRKDTVDVVGDEREIYYYSEFSFFEL